MTALTDATLALLDAHHRHLVEVARTGDVDAPSGSTEWDVAQVLSHLGSQSEIAMASWRSALDGTPAPEEGFNQSVWDRWDALDNAGKAAAFVESDTALNDLLQSLTAEQRETVRVKLFLSEPFTVEQTVGLRLSEVTHHRWDVDVAADPGAGLHEEAAPLMLEHLSGGLGFLLGFTGKGDAVPDGTVVDLAGSGVHLVVEGGSPGLTKEDREPTASFRGPVEAAVRLLAGRLRPEHTPADVAVEGSVTLEDLRRVFPGF